MQKRNYDDDDGRVIADMSGIERQPVLLPHLPNRKKENGSPEPASADLPEYQLTEEERRSYVGGALSAALLIAGVFIGPGAIVILLLWLFLQ